MPEHKRPLKVFLCHASQDKPKVRELYRTLRRRGMQPWLDAEDLIPGQNWEVEIPKALYSSDAIIICLSPNSVDKEGYVQKEIRFALDKALEMPEGRIFLIPAKLEDCDLPFSLRQYQAVNLYEKEGYARLMKALKLRASQLERNTVELPKDGEIILEIEKVVEEKKPVETTQEKLEPKTFESSHKPSSQGVDVGGNVINVGEQEKPSPVKPEEKRIETPRERVERPEPKKTKSPRKINTAIVVALIGLVGTIIAALLGSPIIEKWFSPASVATEMPTATFTPTSQPITLSPSLEPIQISTTPTTTITPTESFTLTATSLPTEITDAKGVSMVLVPAGNFIMGSDSGSDDEKPTHTLYLDTFYIDKFEVTNARYKECVESNVCQSPKYPYKHFGTAEVYFGNPQYDDYPVVFVDWFMAKNYCEWRESRLPTEAEWEKAARGIDGRSYPWGENIGCEYSNYDYCNEGISSVGMYEKGKSVFGVYDMFGNAQEWVSSLHQSYRYDESDGRENLAGEGKRIVRDVSWAGQHAYYNVIRLTFRLPRDPTKYDNSVGIRCAYDVIP